MTVTREAEDIGDPPAFVMAMTNEAALSQRVQDALLTS